MKIGNMFIVLLFCGTVILTAQTSVTDIAGFRAYRWDTPYAEMSQGLVKSSSFNPGFKGFEKTGDDMHFAGVEAHTIIYLFKKDKLNCVSLGYYNKQLDSLLINLKSMYGEPRATVNDFLKNYEWHFPSTVMVLSYFAANESDKSVALGLRKPK
jgi:hypothetical protein